MIDGKTHAEILDMTCSKRKRWYQRLGFVDRGWAMEIVKTAKLAEHSEYMKGENNPNYGKTHSEATRAKLREKMMGEKNPMYGMTGENNPAKRPEVRTKISATMIRAALKGENNPNWQGGKSFEPYCPKFNYDKKEEVRNRDGRRCQSCGKSEILEGRRLSVHHIDSDKMNSDLSNLAALCRSCNAKTDTPEKEFLIVSNLSLTQRLSDEAHLLLEGNEQ